MTDMDAINALPDLERQALTLRKVHGCDQHEIALRLHISDVEVEKLLTTGFLAFYRATKGN